MTDAAARRLRRAGTFFVGLLVVLIGLEVVARAAEASSVPALRWYDASTQLRVDDMADGRDADVVFAGTSMAWQGLVPAAWTANDTAGRSAYNVGMAGGVPEVMEPWLLEVVHPRLQPELVVWGLSSLDFSTAYGADNIERYRDALDAREGFLADVEQTVSDYSALVRYRNVLRDPNEWGEDRGFSGAAAALGADGERRDFVVDVSAARERQVAARLTNYAIDRADIAAIHRTVTALRAAGTEVVFVQMPIPDRYVELHPLGAADVASARNAVVALGKVLDVEVIDVTTGFTELDFVDYTHLDEKSAGELTERVVRELVDEEPTAVDPVAPEAVIDDAELLAIANDLVALADITRSVITQNGSLPASSELWYSSIEYGHSRDLWTYHDEGTDFHTLFAGSSMVYAGLDPAVYDQETGLTAYNTGLPDAGPIEWASFWDDAVHPAVSPQRVVIGVAPRDFATKPSGNTCAPSLAGYNQALSLRQNVFGAVNWFSSVSQPHLLFSDPVVHEPNRIVPMHERYRNAFSLLGDRTFYPTPGAKKLAELRERIEDFMSSFEFCDERLDALTDFIGDLKNRGMEVVVLAMPLSSTRVNPLPGGRPQMEQIMADVGAASLAAGADQYIDFKDLLDDSQFYDYTHTTLAASHELTRELATALGG